MADELPAADTPAIAAIAGSGLDVRVVRTPRAGSAAESAELQGIELGALLRTIVVRRGDGDYLFVLVPADRRFDWPKLRAHLGIRRLTLPDADEARRATGYERYTITPFGATTPWPVIIDHSAMTFDRVSVGAEPSASVCMSLRRISCVISTRTSSTCRRSSRRRSGID